jgi:hypothetical protein
MNEYQVMIIVVNTSYMHKELSNKLNLTILIKS